jgi:hypothetical protein
MRRLKEKVKEEKGHSFFTCMRGDKKKRRSVEKKKRRGTREKMAHKIRG